MWAVGSTLVLVLILSVSTLSFSQVYAKWLAAAGGKYVGVLLVMIYYTGKTAGHCHYFAWCSDLIDPTQFTRK